MTYLGNHLTKIILQIKKLASVPKPNNILEKIIKL